MSDERSAEPGQRPRLERRARALFVLDERERLIEKGAVADLGELCGGDSELVAEAETLAERLERVDRTLDAPLRTQAPSFVALGVTLRILHPLGSGGQGRVHLAFDATLKREVAVKMSHWMDADSALRLRKEAEIAARLNHPGIVPILGSGVTELGLPFLVMRYVPGATLEGLLSEPKRHSTEEEFEASVRKALGALSDVCRTVAYAHRCCIVHCDLKPGNILAGDCGETALLDWGLSTPFKVNASAPAPTNQDAFRAMLVSHASTLRDHAQDCGTTEFMSPERIAGNGELGPWTDVYSLGAILDWIASRRREASDAGSATYSQGMPSGKFALHSTVKRRCQDLADLACTPDPAQRMKSADEFADSIDLVLKLESLTRAPRRRSLFRMFRKTDA